MLSKRSKGLLLAASIALAGCAGAQKKTFENMSVCLPVAPGLFSCVDEQGHTFSMEFEQSLELMCFVSDQFKKFNESCHQY